MSWTLSYEMAEQFATRNRYQDPIVLRGNVVHRHVLMAVRDDEEEEVVVKPGSVNLTARNEP